MKMKTVMAWWISLSNSLNIFSFPFTCCCYWTRTQLLQMKYSHFTRKKLFSFVLNSQFCIEVVSSIPFRIVTNLLLFVGAFFMCVCRHQQPFLCVIYIRLLFVKIFSCAQLLKLPRIFTWFALHQNGSLTVPATIIAPFISDRSI